MNRNKPAIFYVDQNSAFYYDGQQVFSLAFTADVVADQEIISDEKFQNLISSFIEANKIEVSILAIVLSSAISYEKIYDGTTVLTEKDNQDIKNFIELVPFEDVTDKLYKIGKKTIAIGVNRKMVDSARVAFEKHKFIIAAVTPYIILQNVIPELADQVNFDLMLSRFDALKQYNMVENVTVVENNPNPTTGAASAKSPKDNKRIYALVGVFGVLGVILIIMVVNALSPQKKTPQPVAPLIPIPTVVSEQGGKGTNSAGDSVPVETTSSSPSGNTKPF